VSTATRRSTSIAGSGIDSIVGRVAVGPGVGGSARRSTFSSATSCSGRTSRGGGATTAPSDRAGAIHIAPDWICEVLSPSTENIDRVDKLQSYFKARVTHYWLADPVERVLEVYRRSEPGYLLILTAKAGQRVRAEPFDAVELSVDELFGADPADE
jgi:hypothetical protein